MPILPPQPSILLESLRNMGYTLKSAIADIVDNEYMLADDLLVAPIASGTGDEREVYLPTSAAWCDYFTGEDVPPGKFTVKTKGIPVYRKK